MHCSSAAKLYSTMQKLGPCDKNVLCVVLALQQCSGNIMQPVQYPFNFFNCILP
jgi:hypothetical protein